MKSRVCSSVSGAAFQRSSTAFATLRTSGALSINVPSRSKTTRSGAGRQGAAVWSDGGQVMADPDAGAGYPAPTRASGAGQCDPPRTTLQLVEPQLSQQSCGANRIRTICRVSISPAVRPKLNAGV